MTARRTASTVTWTQLKTWNGGHDVGLTFTFDRSDYDVRSGGRRAAHYLSTPRPTIDLAA
jgi:hypothetical protein